MSDLFTKQMLFMGVTVLAAVLGSVLRGPVWGLVIYHLYGVLRPQFLWDWALPGDVQWSMIAACAVLGGMLLNPPVLPPAGVEARGGVRRLSRAHKAVLLFGVWVCLTYFTARNQDRAYPYLVEYVKIFFMFGVGALVLRTVNEVWALFLVAGATLAYIALQTNIEYLRNYYLFLLRRGYCGMDNNGAGLMLAMGVPLCFYAWEGMTRSLRWVFLAMVPVLLHAVLLSYSRGAMLALALTTPLYLVRSRFRGQVALVLIAIGMMIPVLAGKEIRERFSSTAEYSADESARSRLNTWKIALRMTLENPVFGMGIRNSTLYTYEYGADIPGRAIHSQYLQTAADSGAVALALYLAALFLVWRSIRGVLGETRRRVDVEGRRAHAVAAGVEGAMAVFCVGATFLSVETFELPYLLLLLGAQLPLALRPAPAPDAVSSGANVPAGGVEGVPVAVG